MRGVLLVGLASSLAACGGSTNQPPDAAPDEPPSLSGSWRIESGPLLAPAVFGLDGFTFVEFTGDGPSGTGTLYGEVSGIKGCVPIIFSKVGNGAVSVSLGNTPSLWLRLLEFEGTDKAVLTDDMGTETVLTRVDDVPQESRCQELQASRTINLSVDPDSAVGLVYDGALLHYAGEDGTFYTVVPETGVVSSPGPTPAYGQYDRIGAFQADSYWAHCSCGQNDDVVRFDAAATLLDEVDTGALGRPISVSAIAFDGTSLWLAGYSQIPGTSENQVLQIDASGAKNVVADFIAFPRNIKALTTRGDELWAITSGLEQVVVQLDIDASTAVQTFDLPEGYQALALAFAGESLFILAEDEVQRAPVLLETTLP